MGGGGVTALFLIFYLNLILAFRIIVKAQRLESVTHKRNVRINDLDLWASKSLGVFFRPYREKFVAKAQRLFEILHCNKSVTHRMTERWIVRLMDGQMDTPKFISPLLVKAGDN